MAATDQIEALARQLAGDAWDAMSAAERDRIRLEVLRTMNGNAKREPSQVNQRRG